ncbi:MAG TPA: DUF4192 domain-containing protein [Micromonosporaceae bacterium]|nr:DUF4192 domain-containing protein [Micromonosporaceae bacterium]
MTTSSTAALRLRSPSDILAAVPYLLGFHPTDSLVILGLRARRLVFHARSDVLPVGLPAADRAGQAEALAGLFVGQGVTQVILVGYGDPAQVTPTVLVVREAMRARGLLPAEVLRATADRYWSYECDQACCPAEGVPYEVAGSVVAAAATVAGCVALPDRAAVVRTLDPPTGLALVAIQQAGERAAARLAEVLAAGSPNRLVAEGRAAVRSGLDRYGVLERPAADGAGRLSDDEVAWLSVLVTVSLPVRDWAWQGLDRRPADREAAERLWTDVVRRCEPDLVPGPAVLLAYALWRLGDGVRASIAVDRALAADPGYPAAKLIAELLRRAIPPTAMPDLVSAGRPTRRRQRAARRRTR